MGCGCSLCSASASVWDAGFDVGYTGELLDESGVCDAKGPSAHKPGVRNKYKCEGQYCVTICLGQWTPKSRTSGRARILGVYLGERDQDRVK